MIRCIGYQPIVLMEWDSTPEERTTALREQDEFQKNAAWFSKNAKEIRDKHPGRFVCVAGQELFVGDDPVEVIASARAAHPELTGGFFTKRISHHRGPKIYAHQRTLG